MKKVDWAEAIDEWRTALTDTEQAKADIVPDDCLTTKQLGARLGCKSSRANEIAKTLVDAGRAEPLVFKILVGTSLRKVPHYRLKK